MAGIIADGDPADVDGCQAIGEAGCKHRAGTDSGVCVQVIELEPFDAVGERLKGAQFVKRSQWPAAGQRNPDPACAARPVRDLQCQHAGYRRALSCSA